MTIGRQLTGRDVRRHPGWVAEMAGELTAGAWVADQGPGASQAVLEFAARL